MNLKEKKKRVVEACRDIYKNGLVRNTGTGGNVSARDPDSGMIIVTPSQVRYDTIESKDMVVISSDGEVVEARENRKPTTEYFTHRLIYKKYDEVNGVIHTHSTYANVLATLYDRIPSTHTEFDYFIGGSAPVSRYVSPGTEDMARLVVKELKNCPVMVICNHGPVAVGEDLNMALNRVLALEDTAKIYYKALCLGEPSVIPKGD